MQWTDVKVKDLMLIKEINESDKTEDEKSLLLASVVYGIEYKELLNMKIERLRELLDGLEFLRHPLPKTTVRRKYEVNGRKYTLLKNPSDMTVSQYINFNQLSGDFDSHIPELLAIMLVPEGKKYGEGDYDQILEDMENFPAVEGLAIANFFTRKFQRLIRHSLIYLRAAVWQMKRKIRKMQPGEMKEALELEASLLERELQ